MMWEESISRRKLIKLLGAGGLGMLAEPFTFMTKGYQQDSMRKRVIPSSGEELPVVGLGTWIQFDVGESESERAPLRKVLKLMAGQGGEVIDSSPMYGNSEEVVGDLTTKLGIADQFFYATKVWTRGHRSGINQMEASMRKMRRETIDLMQVHNLVDWDTHLETLQEWKKQEKIRYIGITHYTVSSHDRLEQIIEEHNIDFVQFNYSIQTRNAEQSLLDTAHKNEVAVLINQPYEGGSLFGIVQDKKLPNWVQDYDINSWGQYFLKYILSHPAVTCVIPGTSDPEHLVDNMGAGYGRLPDRMGRQKMVKYFEQL